jgi:DNA repair protein RecO (recombination protein O)
MQKLWVIRKQPYRETSALLTVLLDDNRLIRCIARGGGKASEFQPLFGVLVTNKGFSNLSKIEPAGPRLPMSGVGLISGLYLNEITHWMIPEGAEVESLFDTYTRSVKEVSLGEIRALRFYERCLLEAAGNYPVLDRDRNGQTLRQGAWYRLHQYQELVEVRSDEPDALIAEHWLSLAAGSYDDELTLKYGKWLHRSLVDIALGGRRLVSREMLTEVGKAR